MLPPTIKRRTTHSKTTNNQNCQKIELYGNPTTKELKKKHSHTPVGGVETGSQGREDSWQIKSLEDHGRQAGGSWWTRWSHICMQIKLEGTTGE